MNTAKKYISKNYKITCEDYSLHQLFLTAKSQMTISRELTK